MSSRMPGRARTATPEVARGAALQRVPAPALREGVEVIAGVARAFTARGFLYPHGGLLVIRLARERVKRALRRLIRVRLGVMERDKDLSRRDGFRDAKLDGAHPPPA